MRLIQFFNWRNSKTPWPWRVAYGLAQIGEGVVCALSLGYLNANLVMPLLYIAYRRGYFIENDFPPMEPVSFDAEIF